MDLSLTKCVSTCDWKYEDKRRSIARDTKISIFNFVVIETIKMHDLLWIITLNDLWIVWSKEILFDTCLYIKFMNDENIMQKLCKNYNMLHINMNLCDVNIT